MSTIQIVHKTLTWIGFMAKVIGISLYIIKYQKHVTASKQK